jgi:hypothetical protein
LLSQLFEFDLQNSDVASSPFDLSCMAQLGSERRVLWDLNICPTTTIEWKKMLMTAAYIVEATSRVSCEV